jgi:hypothetical protein
MDGAPVATDQKVGGSSPSERAPFFRRSSRWLPLVGIAVLVIWPDSGRTDVHRRRDLPGVGGPTSYASSGLGTGARRACCKLAPDA